MRTAIPATLKGAWSVLARDARRLGRSPLALAIVLGACLLPSAYAWYCIAANWNPYAHTDALAVAVVSRDKGATVEMPGEQEALRLDAGAQLIERLRGNDQLGWRFPSYGEALEGVYAGTYFAAIIIPEDFSANLASIASGSFTRPQLDYYVNEKLSAVAPKMTEVGATQIESEIDRQFVSAVAATIASVVQQTGGSVQAQAEEAEGTMTERMRQAQSVLDEASALMNAQNEGLASTRKLLGEAASALEAAHSAGEQLEGGLEDALALVEEVEGRIAAIIASLEEPGSDEGGGGADDGGGGESPDGVEGDAGADAGEEAGGAESPDGVTGDTGETDPEADEGAANPESAQKAELLAVEAAPASSDENANRAEAASLGPNEAAALARSLVPLGSATGLMQGLSSLASPAIDQVESTIELVDSLIDQAQQANDGSLAFLEQASSSLDGALARLRIIQSSALARDLDALSALNPTSFGSFLASPVTLETHAVFPVANYGSGVAPFYVNLALWVTSFVLLALVRIRVDNEGVGSLTPAQAYLGRLGLFLVLGTLAASIVCAGCLLMGIQCASPAAFMAAGIVAALAYINVVFALCHAFRHFGRAAAVVLLIMQIPGSSGMYPVEMMPAFFQIIHPLLPFTHSIAAMRETIGGFAGHAFATELGTVGLFGLVALGTGLALLRARGSFSTAFDRALGQADLFEAERLEGDDTQERP